MYMSTKKRIIKSQYVSKNDKGEIQYNSTRMHEGNNPWEKISDDMKDMNIWNAYNKHTGVQRSQILNLNIFDKIINE